jgi:hypothetical protein
MKLEEAFKLYSDETTLRRASFKDTFPEYVDKEKLQEYLESGGGAYDIGWLKKQHARADKELRKLGFIIPDYMIEDANADDWELVKINP